MANGNSADGRGGKKPQRVAIIGGGIAGLSCAKRLSSATDDKKNRMFEVTVFDTGRLRPGGRCSSRLAGDLPKHSDERSYPILSKFRFDHAAQILAVPETARCDDDAFSMQVQEWLERGILTSFTAGSVAQILPPDNKNETSGKFLLLSLIDDANNDENPSSRAVSYYYSTDGMSSLAAAMVDPNRFRLQQDCWVSPSNGVRYMRKSKQWRLQAAGKGLGTFDKIIIAHNGKCADRLMSRTPAKDVHALLRVRFSSTVPAHGGKLMTLNSIYSFTFAVSGREAAMLSSALPEPFVCGFVQNHKSLRFVTCQTRKLKPNSKNQDDIRVWTVLSSAGFAKKYKAPQEFLPEETVDQVSTLLLQSLAEALDLPRPPRILEGRLQLWGAALPLNVWRNGNSKKNTSVTASATAGGGSGFVYDDEYGVGVCGDWLVEPSIAGAWTSGHQLADHLICWQQQKEQHQNDRVATTTGDLCSSVGLQGSFQRSDSASRLGIGALSL